MKNILFSLLLLPLLCEAQIVTTFAGNGNNPCWGCPTYFGDGGPAIYAQFSTPYDVATDKWGNVYIADQDNLLIRKIGTDGIISTVAGNTNIGYRYYGDGGPATNAPLQGADEVGVDDTGNIYIVERDGGDVRKVNTAGILSTLAGADYNGCAGDGGPATAALMEGPMSVAADHAGNIYIGHYYCNRIRKVNTAGIISTFAGDGVTGYSGDGLLAWNAQIAGASQIVFDTAGNMYFADEGNHRVRKVNTQQVISTYVGNGIQGFAGDGGPAAAAELNGPSGIALDKNGYLYIADEFRVRRVTPDGIITTIAGNGQTGYSGDGGPALNASFSYLSSIAVDTAGNVYVADPFNNVIRKISKIPPERWSFSVYPNPATSTITITAEDPITSITITNMLGQRVYSQAGAGDHREQIDISLLPPAMYLLCVNGSMTKKLIRG